MIIKQDGLEQPHHARTLSRLLINRSHIFPGFFSNDSLSFPRKIFHNVTL